jgi:hypothetical protein
VLYARPRDVLEKLKIVILASGRGANSGGITSRGGGVLGEVALTTASLCSKQGFGGLLYTIDEFFDVRVGRIPIFVMIAEVSKVTKSLNSPPCWNLHDACAFQRFVEVANRGVLLAYLYFVVCGDPGPDVFLAPSTAPAAR